MKLRLEPEHRELLYRGSDAVRVDFYQQVVEPLLFLIGHQPPSVSSAHDRLAELTSLLGTDRETDLDIPDEPGFELLRATIARRRRQVAAEIERKIALVHDEQLKKQVQRTLAPYDDFTRVSWFRDGTVFRIPRLADYLVMELAEKYDPVLSKSNSRQRQTDEKFHILQAPQLFLTDLDETRARCELREIGCAVAFIDIDDFKKFNSDHTEPVVDMRVLPKFMRAIEAHLFQRGHAYRVGGDEYMLLLHNSTKNDAIQFIENLRAKLEGLTYQDIVGTTTVSIGLVHIPPGSFLTSQEIQGKAAVAKARAKEAGKNCAATYSDPYCEELEVLPRNA
jgi:diguanylate cyclase (GGDEF)-like protein